MSSPSSQQSNPPNSKNQGVIIAASKKNHQNMSASDEEAQLLNTNSDEEYRQNVIMNELSNSSSKSSRYFSLPFIWFISASTLLPLIIVVLKFTMADANTPFSLSFVLGIITCIFGGCYFIPHMALKDEMINTYELNQKKRMHTDKMHGEINRIQQHGKELRESRKKILEQNKETKQLLANLQMMNVDSLDELNTQKGKAKKIYVEWAQALLKKERILLHTLYDRFEFMDDSPGMTKFEFNQFIKNLPDGYGERMERLGTFDKLSDGNGIIMYDAFKSALDVFAEMELNDCDIDFEIDKQETGVDDKGNKTFKNTIKQKSKKARRMVKNNWFTSQDDQK